MPTTLTLTANPFVWYEVMTSDMKASEAFYTKVIGWTAKDAGMPQGGYTLFSTGATEVAGLMPISPDAAAMGVKVKVSAWQEDGTITCELAD